MIFITGVTSGVGRETARRFIKEGWKVIGTGRRQSASTNSPPNWAEISSPLFRRRQA
ncbi:MAG: SDR family NAD(P)-dependent oxidoreductase [Bilophila wadsworthia]